MPVSPTASQNAPRSPAYWAVTALTGKPSPAETTLMTDSELTARG